MSGGYQRFPFDQSRSNVIKRKFSLAYASARFLSATTTRTHKGKRETDEREEAESAMPPYLNWLVDTIWRLYCTSFLRPQGAGVESTEYILRIEKKRANGTTTICRGGGKQKRASQRSTYSIRLFFEVMGSSSFMPRSIRMCDQRILRKTIPHLTLT